jgi:peptide/nickel transport system substrate-binding protein
MRGRYDEQGMNAGINPVRRGRVRSMCVVGVVVALAVSACGSSSKSTTEGHTTAASFYTGPTPGGKPVRGGVVTVVHNEPIDSLDPVRIAQPNEAQLGATMFDQLFEYEAGVNEPQPALAESYSLSPNHLTYTFHIRTHVYFSNGEPVTAEDVVYSLDRQKSSIAALGTALTNGWKSVTATGPMTVKLQLAEPRGAEIGDLGLVQASIVPKKLIEREGETAFDAHPVGTGAFVFKSATASNTSVTVTRNPHYWRAGQPYLDGLVFNVVTETNARILAVRTGAAQVATAISFSQVAALRNTPGVRMLIRPQRSTDTVFFNNGTAPLNDVKVRLALNYATPRQEIIKAVFKGLGEPADEPVGHLQYWDPHVPAFPFDMAKAKELLKSSSAPHGFETTAIVPAGEPDAALVASILQSTWGRLGVHLNIQAVEPTAFFADWGASKYDVAILPDETFGSEQYPPDLSVFFNYDYPDSGNRADASNYNSPRAIGLVRRAMKSNDNVERAKLFSELQKLVTLEEAPIMGIAELPSRTLVSSSLRGFDVLPGNFMPYHGVWLEK